MDSTMGHPVLKMEKATDRFAVFVVGTGVSVDEICEGALIFDLKDRKVASYLKCPGATYACVVDTIDSDRCEARAVCKDRHGDTKKPKIVKWLSICKK
jgi:hypothetical protein